jgi:hypothetical protein
MAAELAQRNAAPYISMQALIKNQLLPAVREEVPGLLTPAEPEALNSDLCYEENRLRADPALLWLALPCCSRQSADTRK